MQLYAPPGLRRPAPLGRPQCGCRRSLAPPPTASTAGPSFLQKLGRVITEKAQSDLERLTKGASKTRDRLGVRIYGGVGGVGEEFRG